MKVLIVLAVLVASAIAWDRRYDGYQVYSVKARDEAGYAALVKIANESDNYDFWTPPRGMDRSIDVMVPPAFASRFVDALNAYNIQYHIKIADVQAEIEESRADMAPEIHRFSQRASSRAMDWTNYHNYDDILTFVRDVARNNPNLVTLNEQYKSYENRIMPLLKISSGGTGKKAIFVDGGIHAREWIAPAFTTWLINELVTNSTALLDKVDWYIMPLINPDGYAYTWSNDRLWRKNRRPITALCNGTDMNRNFGFHWDEGGSSDTACSDTYNGGSAFSEIESRNVRDAILAVSANTAAYLTFHSYGQYWLTPWGYTSALPSDYADLIKVANDGAAAIKAVNGTTYTTGTSTNVLYVASGGSDDWAKGVAGVKYSYTLELRDKRTFELPANQIIPNNLEVFEGVKVVAKVVAGL